jgi:predicted nuclease of predicted toxin-antitoxin system
MRFLVDQDVYAVSVQYLSGLGHDVAIAAEKGLSRASDEELFQAAMMTDGFS